MCCYASWPAIRYTRLRVIAVPQFETGIAYKFPNEAGTGGIGTSI